jgi:chromosome partitioning protein
MARKVSMINMKDGVGKSTLAVNLAWHFFWWKKKRVLLVDLDPQFNASQYTLGVTAFQNIIEGQKPTVWNIFEQYSRSPAMPNPGPFDIKSAIYNVRKRADGARLDLIPSRLELAHTLRSPAQKEDLLGRAIRQIESEYDLVIYDCAPTESFLTYAAYAASDQIVIPVKPQFLSTIGLPLLAQSLADFKGQRGGAGPDIAGILFTHTEAYSPEEIISKKEVKAVANQRGWYVFDKEMPFSRSFPKGAREGSPIFGTSHARGVQIQRFTAMADEFAQRVGL